MWHISSKDLVVGSYDVHCGFPCKLIHKLIAEKICLGYFTNEGHSAIFRYVEDPLTTKHFRLFWHFLIWKKKYYFWKSWAASINSKKLSSKFSSVGCKQILNNGIDI
jgi:hypothetical protein